MMFDQKYWKYFKIPGSIWIISFMLLNIIFRGGAGTNELSRYATLRAMSEEFTFKIDKYVDWTIDWSQTRDGSYYSNKAPGPMFLSFPIFFVMDHISKFDKKYSSSSPPGPTTRAIVVLVTQIIPFALLALLIAIYLKKINVPIAGIHFAMLAILYGNTASFFINTLFGHASSAGFLLAAYLYLLKKNYKAVGFTYGMALLSEYTAALILPILVITIAIENKKKFSWIKDTIVGGSFPGILWCWYHISTCGSPFIIPAQFQNPIWQDFSPKSHLFLGMFSIDLQWNILQELVVGNMRGLLFTQPWLLLAAIIAPIVLYRNRFSKINLGIFYFFALSGIITLLLMNSSFNGWHGGHTSGPRYLSMMLPIWGFFVGICYKYLNKWERLLIWASLVPSILLRALVLGSTIMAHEKPLWPFLWQFMQGQPEGKGYWRMGIFIFFILVGAILSYLTYIKSNSRVLKDISI